ncbi:MAG: NAD(P)/FAD-dependent oxidoreductase, partial [Corallococcus sp.]|nr:NAD(P)/FAD-dependent oxidoreductase [Corallococcus sp.]
MKIAVIGGGPAGMMAAITAAKNGAQVNLIEKNGKLGRKIYITGKGRCNLTNNCDARTFLENVATNAKFLYGAIYNWDSSRTIEFFEDNN